MRTRTVALGFATITLGCAWAGARQGAPSAPTPANALAERAAWKARHKAAMDRLAPLVGEWKAEGTYGEAKADGSFDRQTGVWKNRWLYDGAHLEMTFEVDVNSERRRYMCVASYNMVRERYETVWVGDSGYRFAETGTFDKDGKILTLVSMQDRAGTEKQAKVVSVFTLAGADRVVIEDTSTEPLTGKTQRSFYVELTRVK